MLEALWSVTFVVPTFGSYGAGVVVLENGTVRGGDSTYYYIGNFRVKDDVVIADVSINHYFGPLNNVFGAVQKIQITLSGTPSYDSFELTGKSTDSQIPIVVKFKRIAELSA